MKYYLPEDYDRFSCLKDQCNHTCCAEWEIDIDPDTWRLYQELPGPVGEHARASVTQTGDVVSFRLDEKGRCPMLTEDHLCSLILAFGEYVLCNICADHPRYRNFFSDRVEMGLGLCCEAVARQTVNRTEPYRLRLASEEPGGTPLTETEKNILSFREKLVSILQQESIPYRTKEADAVALLPPFQWPEEDQDRAFLSGLERLDPSWDKSLALLQTPTMSLLENPGWGRALSQLAVSFLFRHLPDAAEDGLLRSRALFSLWSVRLIDRMTRTDSLDELADTARAYSSEIEYSDDNLKACFSYLENCFL